MNPRSVSSVLSPAQFDLYVGADVDGEATPEELAVLEADWPAWHASLQRLLREAEEHLATARLLPGEERDQVVADLASERRRMSAAWARLTAAHGAGPDDRRHRGGRENRDESRVAPGTIRLQVSWEPGRVVAWAAGPRTAPVDNELVMTMLTAAGAPASVWTRHAAVPLPRSPHAEFARRSGRRSVGMAGRRRGQSGGRRHRPQRALVGADRDLGGGVNCAWRDGSAVASTTAGPGRRE